MADLRFDAILVSHPRYGFFRKTGGQACILPNYMSVIPDTVSFHTGGGEGDAASPLSFSEMAPEASGESRLTLHS